LPEILPGNAETIQLARPEYPGFPHHAGD